MNGIFLSADQLARLPLQSRVEIRSLLGMGDDDRIPHVAVAAQVIHSNADNEPDSSGDEEGPAELTLALTKKLMDRLGPKTKKALRTIAKGDTPDFQLAAIATEFGFAKERAADLRGVWAGLTRSVRSILGDPESTLIGWTWDDDLDDYVGTISRMTYESLRKVFSS